MLLLEGGYHHRHPLLDMPPGVFKLLKNGSKFFRTHKSTPQSQLGGRQTEIPQGNVLGGGSTVNGQAYVRGRPQDYDAWHAALRGSNDAVHWDWEAVLPHFKRLEGNRKFNDDLHGCDGPLTVSDPGHIDDMARWFVQALQAQGEPFNPDFNGKSQRGAGFFQFTYDRGQRVSAAYAFLDPIKNNPKLTIRLRSTVQRVLIQDGRAVGVVYRDKSGTEHTARCAGEVILSAGALITPLFSTIPTMGTGLVVDAFLVVIVGGLGSLIGAASASVLIGEATALFSIVINDTLGRIAVLAGIIVLIRFRPRGLFPTETRR